MVDLRGAYEELSQLLPDHFCVRVSVWNHRHGRGPRVTVDVWDGVKHYSASSVATVMALVRDAHHPPPPDLVVVPPETVVSEDTP